MEEESRNYHCKSCGFDTPDPNFVRCESGPHYGKYTCPRCDKLIQWVSKPDAERRSQRTKKHLRMVKEFGRGYCEICLVKADAMNEGECMTGHHILEYTQHEGDATADNALIVCTSCHEMIHLLRRQAIRSRGGSSVYGEPQEQEALTDGP